MTRVIGLGGQKNTKFTLWDTNQQYRPGDMVVYNNEVYTTTQNIPAGTGWGAEWSLALSSGGGTPGGANTQVQFNDNGVFGASSSFTFVADTDTVTAYNFAVSNEVSSSLIPSSNVTFDLGSSTQRWKDLWLSNSTIHIGDQSISSLNGNISLSGNIEATNLFGNATYATSAGTVARNNVTGGGNAGQIQWADANGNLTSNERYYIQSNGVAGLNVSRDTAGSGFVGTVYTNTVAFTTYSGGRARGTKAAPLPVQIGDRVTSALGFPYTGNGTSSLDNTTGFVINQGAGFTTTVTSLPTGAGNTPGMSVSLIATVSANNSMISASFTENGNFTIPGSFVSSGAQLGDLDNVIIYGGTAGQVLSTDGLGNLSWATSSGGGGTTLPNGTMPWETLAWQYDGVTASWQVAPNPLYWNLPVNNTDAAYNTAVNAVGQGLQEGSRYYNTTNEVLRIYDGGAWQDAGSGSTPMTVATLGTKPAGFRSFVTDSSVPRTAPFGSAITGGGSFKVPVWSDGVDWYLG